MHAPLCRFDVSSVHDAAAALYPKFEDGRRNLRAFRARFRVYMPNTRVYEYAYVNVRVRMKCTCARMHVRRVCTCPVRAYVDVHVRMAHARVRESCACARVCNCAILRTP